MKKKIVYLLCELGLFKIARLISPSLVFVWYGNKFAKIMEKQMKESESLLVEQIIKETRCGE